MKPVADRHRPHLPSHARCRHTTAWRTGLTALSIASLGLVCQAAESLGGLASAFRPQAGTGTQAQGNGERADPGSSGLRIVLSSASGSVATIDGRLVRVGDTVKGMRVSRIDAQGVLLTGEDGATEWLLVNPSAVKSKSGVKASRSLNGVQP